MSKKNAGFFEVIKNTIHFPAFKSNKTKKNQTIDETIDSLFLALDGKKKPIPWFLIFVAVVSVVILSFVLFLSTTYHRATVLSDTMNSSIVKGNKLLYQDDLPINRFNIVLVEKNGEQNVLRVIGMPGDSLSLTDDVLKLNNTEYDEPYLKRNYITFKADENNTEKNYTENFDLSMISQSNEENQHVPRDKYVLLGDNRQADTDSRKIGYYDEKDIKGTVLLRIWPISEFGPIE